MKGIATAAILFFIMFVFGQIIDQCIDSTMKISTGLVLVPLYGLKILLGIPTDWIELILKLFLLIGVAVGGEAI